MDEQMGLTEFFAMEAGDYVERLDALVSPPTPPDPDELVRLTRALRGSALMAKQADIASAAAAFEQFARDVKERRRYWDDATKQTAVRAVDEFKVLIRQVGSWSERDSERARALALELDPEASVTAPSEQEPSRGLDAGTRAFIGREGAAVGSAVDQAAKALQQNPDAHDALRRVITVMQPLRGLAILAELPPMPDLLDGVRRAVSETLARRLPAERAPRVLSTAANALTRAAKEIATEGKAQPESPEMLQFVEELRVFADAEASVIPIEDLNYDDGGAHIVERGSAPARRRVLGQLELVSHGEHLRQAADELERAWSRTQLELRAQALVTTFRALSVASGSPVHEGVSRFALAARDAVVRGVPMNQTAEFVSTLREAGTALAETGKDDENALAELLRGLAAGLESLTGVPTPAAPPADITPADEIAEPREAPQVAAAPEEDVGALDESPDLVGSWARYERYVAALGLGEPSLEELLAGPPADPRQLAEVSALPGAGPPADAAEPEEEEELIPISDLCFSGWTALERAKSLRGEIRAALESGDTGPRVIDLVEEVLDLVELGTKG